MRTFVLTLTVLASAAMTALAQPPRPEGRPGPGGNAGNVESFLSRLMAFDANKDSKLQKGEVTDARLRPLIERADGDQDGVVTKEELTALFVKESAALAGGRGPGPGGPGDGRGPGGPGQGGPGPAGVGPGPGAPGGPGGPAGRGPSGMMPQPDQVLPPFLQEALGITEAQRKELDELQKDVDAKLAKILTEQQRQQLREMRERGPRGPGFGGPGGPGGQPQREGAGNRRPPNE